MEGYIKSLASGWRHMFKRSIRPGGVVPLDELYNAYGKKYNLPPNEEFVNWLKTVKLKGEMDSWEISLISEKPPENLVSKKSAEAEEAETIAYGATPSSVANKFTIEEIINLSVRKARAIIPNVTDVKLLQYTLKEARPRAGKDSLCRVLEKRIMELKNSI